jgi:hypothetical protein
MKDGCDSDFESDAKGAGWVLESSIQEGTDTHRHHLQHLFFRTVAHTGSEQLLIEHLRVVRAYCAKWIRDIRSRPPETERLTVEKSNVLDFEQKTDNKKTISEYAEEEREPEASYTGLFTNQACLSCGRMLDFDEEDDICGECKCL